MSEGTIGLLILLGTSVVVAVLAHSFVRHYLRAVICAALIASLAFNLAAYLHHPDPFLGIALVVAALFSGGIAVLVGLPFTWYRRKNRDDAA